MRDISAGKISWRCGNCMSVLLVFRTKVYHAIDIVILANAIGDTGHHMMTIPSCTDGYIRFLDNVNDRAA